MHLRSRIVGTAVLAVLLAGALWHSRDLHLETDITKFLPDNDARQQLALSGLVRSTGFARGMVLDLSIPGSAPDDPVTADALVAFGDSLANDMRATDMFHSVTNGIAPALANAFYDAYFPRRLAFLSDSPEEAVPVRFSAAGLTDAFSALKDAFLLPSAPLIKRIAAADPLLVFPEQVRRIRETGERISPRIYRDRYFSPDLRNHMVMIETVDPAFNTAAQARVIDAVLAAFASRNDDAGDRFHLAYTGLNRFVLEGETRAKADVAWVSVASTITVALLFLAFFRRIRFLAFAFLPVAYGMALGLGMVAGLRGSIHGLTLGFGSTLIGVCIDYPIHLLTHLRHAHPDSDRLAWRGLVRRLLLGFSTTVIGFSCLAFSGYPGIREIALFCLAGIAGAFAFTWVTLPLFAPLIVTTEPVDAPPDADARLDPIGALRRRLHPHRRKVLAGMIALGIACAATLPALRLETDARALDAADAATTAEDAEIRAHMPTARLPRLLLVSGDTVQQTLERNDALDAALLTVASREKSLQWVSMHPFLPSVSLQQRNLDAIAAIPDLNTRVREALTATGFLPDAFDPFLDALDDARKGRVAPLRPEDLKDTPLATMLQGFLFQHDDRWWALTMAGPEGDLDTLDTIFHEDDLVRIQPAALVSSLVTSSQRETVYLLLAGLVLNAIAISVVRRRPRLILATLGPTLLALLAVAAGMAVAGIPMNFLHVVGMLLILSMGIDYAVFLIGTPRHERTASSVIAERSVLLSALTTLATYGLLATCKTAALVSVGATVASGILIVAALTFLTDAIAEAPDAT